MIDQLMTDKESELLLEILATERRRLLPEIRHTDTRRMRTELQVRLRTIDRLIERFGQKWTGPTPRPSGGAAVEAVRPTGR